MTLVTIGKEYKVWQAAATAKDRPILNYICLSRGYAVATNGYILAAVPAPGSEDLDGVLVPASLVKEAKGNYIGIEDGYAVLFGVRHPLGEGTFPNWRRLFPDGAPQENAAGSFDGKQLALVAEAVGVTGGVYPVGSSTSARVIVGAGDALGLIMPAQKTAPAVPEIDRRLNLMRTPAALAIAS